MKSEFIIFLLFIFFSNFAYSNNFNKDILELSNVLEFYPPKIKNEDHKKRILSKYKNLLQQLNTKIEKDNENLNLLFKRGYLYSLGNNLGVKNSWQNAKKDYIKILKKQPDHTKAIVEYGLLYTGEKEHSSWLIDLFKKALEYDEQNVFERAYLGLFYTYYYDESYDKALACISSLLSKYPDNKDYLRFYRLTKEKNDLRKIPDGVVFKKFTHTKTKNKIWIYYPEKRGNKKLPCVVIATAGSRLYHGIALSDEDIVEHIPYAREGFFVIAYDVSGHIENRKSNSETIKAIKDFIKSKGGVTDATNALQFAVKKFNFIDQKNVFAVGHSSAGTVALTAVQHTDIFRACVAYAPIVDLKDRLGDYINELDKKVGNFTKFVNEYSPVLKTQQIKCPVLVFNSTDDGNVTPDHVNILINKMKKEKIKYKHIVVNDGGHYRSMLNKGIPAGIKWMKSIMAK